MRGDWGRICLLSCILGSETSKVELLREDISFTVFVESMSK